MTIRYGDPNCKHDFVLREDGWEEGCVPAICRKCGAFGCACDVPKPMDKKAFFDNGIKSSDKSAAK